MQNTPDAEAAAVRLTTEAFQRGSNDNISCIVVVFRFDGAPAAEVAAHSAAAASEGAGTNGVGQIL